jgi:glutamate-ammonia-ligase adenylyltransferase
MPRVLEAVARVRRPTVALGRVVALLEAVMRRSAYFVLLLENPSVLTELVSICEASGWLAAELARHPMLLDELLDPTLLYTVPDRSALARDLRARLASAGDGGEAALEVLRVFKESHQFRVAACELRGILPLMKISDYLTFLAEVILNEALAIAWREAEAASPAPLKSRPFVIVGYGKLGGLELGPGSDLDLVFLHDLPAGTERTLSRMIRRLLHILTTRTHTGALYEVDTRLRPSGRFGTMVTSLAAFEEYQNSDAWVWEHQALVRARVVAGDPALAARFEALRDKIIRRRRDREELRAKIVEMRERIARSAAEDVDFKRGVGGIVDIEFMVQYLALAYAADYPSLSEFTDNVRILDAAARENLLPTVEAERLKAAYLALRAESHRTALDEPDPERARRVLDAHAEAVRSNWNRLLGAEHTSERAR